MNQTQFSFEFGLSNFTDFLLQSDIDERSFAIF